MDPWDSHVFWLEKFVGATVVQYFGCTVLQGFHGRTVASLEGNTVLRGSWPA